ncbi:uncharacterized protein G2W53_024935 [Senna tora]|uniref:Uncharacterized protein n=1 Tax=Senna tora TaxID=362788 RepID=A0A834TCW7_9FABA|nr:uncharacterized protein G2W53_024935 [Senna tora]
MLSRMYCACGDRKPDNVILERNGHVKLSDHHPQQQLWALTLAEGPIDLQDTVIPESEQKQKLES